MSNKKTTKNTSNKRNSNDSYDKIIGLGKTFYEGSTEDRNDLIKAIALTAVGIGASFLLDKLLKTEGDVDEKEDITSED